MARSKREAFLLEAREDLQYELTAPESDRDAFRYSLVPLALQHADAVLKLSIVDDVAGSMHDLAAVDVGLARKAAAFLIGEIDAELTALRQGGPGADTRGDASKVAL